MPDDAESSEDLDSGSTNNARGRKPGQALDYNRLTLAELSRVLAIRPQTLLQWADRGMPFDEEKTSKKRIFSVAQVFIWRCKDIRNGNQSRKTVRNDPKGLELQKRVWREKGLILRIERLKRQGKVADKLIMIGYFRGVINDARILLETIPGRCGLLIGDEKLRPKIVKQVRDVVYGVLRILAGVEKETEQHEQTEQIGQSDIRSDQLGDGGFNGMVAKNPPAN